MIFSLWTENKLLLTPSLPFLMMSNILRTVFLFVKWGSEFSVAFAEKQGIFKASKFLVVLKGKIIGPMTDCVFCSIRASIICLSRKLAFRLRYFAQRQKLARISYESLVIVILPVDFSHIFHT